MMNHKLLFLFRALLTSVFALAALAACDDWTEMEIHDSQVNGFKEQHPEEYAAYTQNLRAYKATKHPVVYARFDNAPEVSTSDKDFLRSLPDSIDLVTMRRADRLTEFDREDMKLVRTDYGTRVLYGVDAEQGADAVQAAIAAVKSGLFDGITLSVQGVVDDAISNALTAISETPDAVLILDGKPAFIPKPLRSRVTYFISELSAAADEYDLESALMYAQSFGISDRLLLAMEPGNTITDTSGKSHDTMAWIANYFQDITPPLGGIAINNISNDYFDAEIIYKQTRGVIQKLNPATVK